MTNRGRWALCVGIVLLACFGLLFLMWAEEERATGTLPGIIKRIQPSTVAVRIYNEKGKLKSQGSGFFVSPTGQIITNRHVLEGASKSEIKTAQGEIYPVTHILAEDKQADLVLACVDIGTASVSPLKLSDSLPQAGQRVAVIANSPGLEEPVSDGLVLAVLDISVFGKIIQLSVPLSPGSSGSPVVNMKGQVIGVATFSTLEKQTRHFAMSSQRAAKLKPGKPITLAEWGKLTGNKNLVSAEKDYRKGRDYIEKENYEKALRFFKKAVEKSPDYGEAWF